MNDDAELLQRYARTGDAPAFTALVQRHLPMVYRAAWRQLGGDSHAAEDAAQTVFVLLARKARGLGRHENLAGWLHVTTRHVVRDQRRAAARRVAREQEAAHMNTAFNPELSADWNRLRPVLDEAIGELGPADREAVLLRYFQGLSLADVGTSLDLSEDAARMRVNRALEKLREQLARRGVTSTAAALGVALAAEPALAAPWTGLAASVSAAALTQGAAVGTGAAGLGWALHFMNSAKLAATVVVALATVGWATWEHRQLEQASAPVAAPAVSPVAAAPEKPRPMPVAPPPAPVVPRDLRRDGREGEAAARGDALMAAHPGIKAALVEEARAFISARYAHYAVELRWTPAQRAAFEEVMFAGGHGTGTSEANPADNITLLLPKSYLTTPERDALLKQALGPEGLAAFKAYEKGRAGLLNARLVAGLMSDLGDPMTTEQARVVQQVLATRQPKGTRYWDAVMQAASVLPPAQVEVLALFDAQARFYEVDREVAEAEFNAKGGK